jgi:hypothetical protein
MIRVKVKFEEKYCLQQSKVCINKRKAIILLNLETLKSG